MFNTDFSWKKWCQALSFALPIAFLQVNLKIQKTRPTPEESTINVLTHYFGGFGGIVSSSLSSADVLALVKGLLKNCDGIFSL